MEISQELFAQQRRPRFGKTNPERLQIAFWEWMIRGGDPVAEPEGVLTEAGRLKRDSNRKSGYGPYRARDLFKVHFNREDGPQAILPRTVEHMLLPSEEWNGARIVVDEIPVSLRVGVSFIEVIVEGDLPSEKSYQLAEEIRTNAEAVVGRSCIME
jgi:hypothetical protein